MTSTRILVTISVAAFSLEKQKTISALEPSIANFNSYFISIPLFSLLLEICVDSLSPLNLLM